MYFNGNTDRADGGFLNNFPPLTKYRIHGTRASTEENSRATRYDGKLVFIVVKVFHSFQTIVQIQFCARKPYWDRWKLPLAGEILETPRREREREKERQRDGKRKENDLVGLLVSDKDYK